MQAFPSSECACVVSLDAYFVTCVYSHQTSFSPELSGASSWWTWVPVRIYALGPTMCQDESILDPIYCPPEQYVMPTDSPHLAKTVSPLAMVMSSVLWGRHKPDRFDSYSAGVDPLPRFLECASLFGFAPMVVAGG